MHRFLSGEDTREIEYKTPEKSCGEIIYVVFLPKYGQQRNPGASPSSCRPNLTLKLSRNIIIRRSLRCEDALIFKKLRKMEY